jgi:hypothetical protein
MESSSVLGSYAGHTRAARLPAGKKYQPVSTPRISGAPFQPNSLAGVAGCNATPLLPATLANKSSWKGASEILAMENGPMFFTRWKHGCFSVPRISVASGQALQSGA